MPPDDAALQGPPSPDPQAAVVDGDRVRAASRVVAAPGHAVRLCADAPVRGVGYSRATSPPRSGAPQVYLSGASLEKGLEPVHRLGVTVVTPGLRAAADRHRAGLVLFEPTVVALR